MKTFFRVAGAECRKAFCSKAFLLGTALLLLFSVLSAVYMIEVRASYNPGQVLANQVDGQLAHNPDLPLFTFYNSWVGGDDLSLAAALFYALLPVGAALPFGWSYCTERKSGYLKNIYTRVDRKTYLAGKTLAVFLSGAGTVAVSLGVNLLLVLAKVPLVTPFAGYNFYNHIYFGNLWADLYFTAPGLYVLLYAALDVFYGGVFALLSFAVGFYLPSVLAVVFVPFLLTLAAGYGETALYTAWAAAAPVEWVPSYFLHPQVPHYQVMGWAVALVTALLLAFVLLTVCFRGVRHESL